MQFCPKCNAKIRPQKVETMSTSKVSSKVLITCLSCGYSKKSKPIKIKEVKQEDSKTIKVVDKKTQKLQSMPTTKATCNKCGHDYAYFWDKQTSSLEKASTQFFRCEKCSHTWRAT